MLYMKNVVACVRVYNNWISLLTCNLFVLALQLLVVLKDVRVVWRDFLFNASRRYRLDVVYVTTQNNAISLFIVF